ncbi:sco1 protein [Cystoisospora suis]|uniref:Sco1 protein n=1 Tax=Cystoisospora suis TaxID=483139 RepID=A0A2C6L2B4_9APIC|nr:sco1 protein [Cystoisospora suis]
MVSTSRSPCFGFVRRTWIRGRGGASGGGEAPKTLTGLRHVSKGGVSRFSTFSSVLCYHSCFSSQFIFPERPTLRCRLKSQHLIACAPYMSQSFCSSLHPVVSLSLSPSSPLDFPSYPRSSFALSTNVFFSTPSGSLLADSASASFSTLLPRFFSSSTSGSSPSASPRTSPTASPTTPPQPSSSSSSRSDKTVPPKEGRLNLPMPPSSQTSKSQQERNERLDDMKCRRGNVFPWRAALLASCACITIACGVALQSERRKRSQLARTDMDAVGKPLLGGPWTLVDMYGNIRDSEEFVGKYQLIYFGFSFCPDICPQELEKMAQVIEIIVDPKRDTVAQVKAYCEEFHPRLLGFTGTPAQIKDVTRKFRVYFNEGIKNSEEDYLVDHSIIQYFMGRNGKFKDFFGKNMTVREIADQVAKHIKQDKQKEEKKRS